MYINIKLVASISITAIMLSSCNDEMDLPIPDLHPATSEGGEVTIYDIGELVSFSTLQAYSEPQFAVYDNDIDIGGEGNIDLQLDGHYNPGVVIYAFTYLIMRFNAQVIHAPDSQFDIFDNSTPDTYPVFLPVNALTGTTVNGIWSPPNAQLHLIQETKSVDVGELNDVAWEIEFKFPVGQSYIPTRSRVGNDFYYGWIECFASDYTDGDTNDFLLISRFGISQTPGLRVRMGQE